MDISAFFTRLNRPIVWLLRSPLHALADPGLMLVTVTGRRTGRRYTIPVGYQQDGDRIVVLVSKARTKNWWRNFREPGPIEVRLRGRDLTGTARVIEAGSPAYFAAFDKTLSQMPWLGQQFGIPGYVRAAAFDDAQKAALARENAAVEITLDPAR